MKKVIQIINYSTILVFATATSAVCSAELEPVEQLGKSIFFDDTLSINQNQACAACHGPEAGWTGPTDDINLLGSVYEGSIPGRFGDRKPPSAAYATQSPIFHVDSKGQFTGGNFWDGRATGEILGNPAADQAQGPFLNPAEQALPDSACVVYGVCAGAYPVSLEDVWGNEACDIDWPADVESVCMLEDGSVNLSPADRAESDMAYDYIALSIAAYESSSEVNAFSSKFDLAKTGGSKSGKQKKRGRSPSGGKVMLSRQEQRGLALFRGKARCSLCHTSNGKRPLFTDYTFENIGIPQNPENPAGVAPDFVDMGLGDFLKKADYPDEIYEEEMGKQKVPTLRNVDLRPGDEFTKAYGHNGYFKSLEGIVHFYNTRDVKTVCTGPYTEAEALEEDCWPAPEVAENVNTDELGNLGLTAAEEAAIVAFLKTLSDGYTP